MKSSFQSTNVIITICFASLIITGCARHAQVPELVSAPTVTGKAPAALEKTVVSSQEPNAKKIVVAKVNGVELHMDALVNMMNRLASQESGTTPQDLDNHKKRSLDKLILQELAYQQAKARGLSIGANKIDLAIKNLKENVGGEKEYADYLARLNVTEADLRAEVERGLLLETIYYREVLGKVTVPEDVVREEYEKEKRRYLLPEKASVIDVMVLKKEGTASTKKANELLNKIKADTGQDPWKLMLDGTFIVREINVNKDKEKDLFEAAKKLKPNELSGVLETPTGSHILKLVSYSPERQPTFDEVKGKLELKFKVPAQEKRTREWEQELRKDAKIEIIEAGVGGQGAAVGR